MKQQFIKVCMLSGLAMPLFSASLLAAGNPNPIVAQQQQVQGTVVDKTGEPLIGVTVQVVGQQGGKGRTTQVFLHRFHRTSLEGGWSSAQCDHGR